MPTDTPEVAVVSAIVNAHITGLTSANVLRGPVRPHVECLQGKAVFIEEVAGTLNQRYLGSNTNRLLGPVVRVTVRGDPKDHAGGKTLADAVFAALDGATLTGYLLCWCRGSAPALLEMDEEWRPVFAFYLDLRLWQS